MNGDVRDEWVTALESGEYTQGAGFLRESDSFCCLGVLCDIAVKHGVIPEPRLLTSGQHGGKADAQVYSYGTDEDFGRSYTSLPQAVVEWAGVRDESPEVDSPDPHWTESPDEVRTIPLADLNDAGAKFPEIAGYIRDQL